MRRASAKYSNSRSSTDGEWKRTSSTEAIEFDRDSGNCQKEVECELVSDDGEKLLAALRNTLLAICWNELDGENGGIDNRDAAARDTTDEDDEDDESDDELIENEGFTTCDMVQMLVDLATRPSWVTGICQPSSSGTGSAVEQ